MKNILKNVLFLIALLAFAIGIYAYSFWYSLKQVDDFCNSVTVQTKIENLKKIANTSGVELKGPMQMKNASGEYVFAIAASSYTVGEYACRIRGDSFLGYVKSKHLGY